MRNPVIDSDFPDPEIIRVGEIYYMVSTTMYFMPGADILRSWDLAHWELVGHVFDRLEDNAAHNLEGGRHIYAQGMWAPSLSWHEGVFYLTFSCNDTHRSVLFTAADPAGPWKRQEMGGFFYDSSLFFDEDGRVYIVHGQGTLHLTELDPSTWAPLPGGLDRVLVVDEPGIPLGYEGSHLYRRDGRYYLFTCHMPLCESRLKTEACFVADSLEGAFVGRDIIDDDMRYCRHLGVAQGGMVDDPRGNWYLFMFQDRGALGRAPVMMPMTLGPDGLPAIATPDGRVPLDFPGTGAAAPHGLLPLNGSAFCLPGSDALAPWWQFSHNPDPLGWRLEEQNTALRLTSGQLAGNLLQARNVLTQRCMGPVSEAEVTIDASALKDGDFAGLCAYVSHYAAIALHRREGRLYLVTLTARADNPSVWGDKDFFTRAPQVTEIMPVEEPVMTVRVCTDFSGMEDLCTLHYLRGGAWTQAGEAHPMYFKMDLFTGCRFGLFHYATRETGGQAVLRGFRYAGPKA